MSDCDFVIEAATENESLKVSLLRRIDAVARGDAIVATNTSSISIASLAANLERPQAFVGLHFFNPVPVMHLVEVVRGPQSDDATVEAAAALAKQLGKTPVIVKDAPGFVVNRLLLPDVERGGARLFTGHRNAVRHRRGDEARLQPSDRSARAVRPDRSRRGDSR